MNIKKLVVNELQQLGVGVEEEVLQTYLVQSTDIAKGDVSFPCFATAKKLGINPMQFAENLALEINEKIKNAKNSVIKNAVSVSGYVNFFLDKELISNEILQDILVKQENFGKPEIPANKTVFIDYCSVNLAKYMHIGHLKTTVIGAVLANVYSFLGYKTIGINYVGDYGTPFGKIITAYLRWGSKSDVEARGVDAIQEYYVKFNVEAENDETLNEEARAWFSKIENNDKQAVELYRWIIEKSITEVQRLCSILGVSFDSWRGESYYNNKMKPVIAELENKKLLVESEGAKIVNLEPYNLGVSLVQKSDGSSLYVTRDLAAVEDRYCNYAFDKGIYVTSVQQKLHFAQLFKIVELMEKPYAGKLVHVGYGTYSLPTGKIGSRFGKQALVTDMIDAAESKAKEIMETRGTKVDNVEETAKKIAVAALVFDVVKNEKIKDSVFDINSAINFDGETAPYMQYTYARCCSVLAKVQELKDVSNIEQPESLVEEDCYALLKACNKFSDVVLEIAEKYEPCLLSRNLMEICSLFNKFYANVRIINNNQVNLTLVKLVKAVQTVLNNGLKLLNIAPIEKM